MRLRLLAVAALAALALPISSRLHLEITGRTAVGEVTAMRATTDSDGDTSYTPVIEVEIAPGRRVQLEGMMVSPPVYAIGERVDVLYDPADPRGGVIGSPLARAWLWALAVAVAIARRATCARARSVWPSRASSS